MNLDNRREFIKSYINQLEQGLKLYEETPIYEQNIVDIVVETMEVFSNELGDIKEKLTLNFKSIQRDAKILLGLLNKLLMETGVQNSCEIGDLFDRFSIEIDGIENVIEDWELIGEGGNYTNKLKKAIKEKNVVAIKYCLIGIKNWYENILDDISKTDFNIQNKHKNNLNKINNFIEEVKKIPDSCFISNNAIKSSDEPVVFLSHSSKDKKYGDALRNLLIGIGLENEQLIYTSHPLHGIPVGENIFEYLRKHIHSNVFMIFLLSDEYFESVPCLNEMGAAWVSKSDYMSVFIPKFNFRNTKFIDCVIDDKNMGVNLNDPSCRIKILDLKNKIKNIFNLPTDEAKETYLVDKFLEEINKEEL